MRNVLWTGILTVITLGALACKGGEDRVAERAKQLEAARAEARAQKAEAALPEKAPEGPRHPYWDAEDALVLRNEKACPDGLWALFGGPAPGGDEATRKENEARRTELAQALRAKTFVARLRGPSEVTLGEYDAPKGRFPLEVKGVIDCEDSIGRIAVAFNGAKAIDPPSSAISPGALVQSIWQGPARAYEVPMKSMSEAKGFKQKHQLGLEAWVVFRLGKTDVHHKRVKVEKVTNGDVSIGGGTEDFGAGRIVHADVEAVRVVANPGPIVVIDTKNPGEVALR